jgi:hypothetical protein
MKPRVYIVTTIVSYLTVRPSRSLKNRVRQLSTQRWWSSRQADFECVASLLVRDECGAGNSDAAARRLSRMDGLELLLLTPAAVVLAEALFAPTRCPESRRMMRCISRSAPTIVSRFS